MNALSDGWPTWSIGWVHRAGEKAVAPGFYSSAGRCRWCRCCVDSELAAGGGVQCMVTDGQRP